MRRRLLVLAALIATLGLTGCWRQELVRHYHWTHEPGPVYVVPRP